MSDITPIRPPSLEVSFIRGIRSCVALLASNRDEFFVQCTYRRGAPQNNIVRQTLDGILRRGDDKELEGFCALLTEICALTDDDNKRFFSKYADRRERVLRRRYRNKQARMTLAAVPQ